MAAKRKRDYKAEERARNERARKAGFTSRGQQRRAIESGKTPALQPSRLRSPKTIAAQKKLRPATGRRSKNYTVAGNVSLPRKQIMQDWSNYAAGTDMAKYQPERAKKLGVTAAHYDAAYWDAFIDNQSGYHRVRKAGGSSALYYWFVELNHYYHADEYDEKYKL